MKKICPNCGAEAEGNFCPECGTNLTDVEPQKESAYKPEEHVVQDPEQKKEPEKAAGKAELDKFEELKRFKELLDGGIITQEDFDKKKADLLAASAESKSAKVLNSFLNSAKEKSEQAKIAANEKLEELKKKQQMDAEKRKKEEEERKENQAEIEKKKAEQAKLLEEQKRKEAEEKRKQAEEKKEQNKQKRKAFFAKKSVKLAIGIVCALIIAFIGICIIAYLNRETIKDDFNETKSFNIHSLEYEMPSNWAQDKNETKEDGSEQASFIRKDADGNNIAFMDIYYLGDDLDFTDTVNSMTDDTWEEYAVDVNGDQEKAYSKSDTNDSGVALHQYLSVVEKDYSMFYTLITIRDDVMDTDAINRLLTAPLYDKYKNPAEADNLKISYIGERTDGYVASASDFEVTVNYKDGTSSVAKTFDISPASPQVNNGEAITVQVKCHGLEDSIELKGKQAKKLSASYSGSTEAGEVIKKGSPDLTVTVKWDDGTTDTVTDYEMDKEITLKAGKTGEATITAYGKSTTLSVKCSTMSKAQFKDACETRNYKDLLRKASYSEYTKIYGKVLQDCGSGYYRISSGGSAWDNVYMVTVLSGDTLVEDDWVTCYGVTTGIYSYETVMGATQKVPWLTAKYVDID